jgi:hypothetical protein
MGGLTIALILVGLLLLLYLVWVAATSKTFLAISLTTLMASLVAVVFVAAILGVAGVLPWWAALLLAVAGSAVVFLALVPTARFGLSRVERSLRAESPDHWKDGESAVKSAVERLTRIPETVAEGNLLRSDLLRLAAEGHSRRYPHDRADRPYPAFEMAFTSGYSASLKAAGFVAERQKKNPGSPATGSR